MPIYTISIHVASGKSLRLSGAAFSPQKRVMPLRSPMSQDRHDNKMRPYMCEHWLNQDLQTRLSSAEYTLESFFVKNKYFELF